MSIMTMFALAAALCAALALFNGVVSMAHGGSADQASSHKLMLQRVGWQGLTLLFIVLALLANL